MNQKQKEEIDKQEDAAVPPETESPVADSTESVDDVQKLQAELASAQAATDEQKDLFLRAKAEAENVRRRAETDVANARKYAIERFAGELLSVRDSLELARTVDLDQDNKDALAKMHEGLDLTLKLLDSVFEKFAVTVIDPQGEKFDPQLHQAMGMQESEEIEQNHVLNVVQRGYVLNGRLLRPAMVIVSKAKPQALPPADT